QFHQTDFPPPLPAWFGSPVSLVASMLLPVAVFVVLFDGIAIVKAVAKLSFRGAVEVDVRALFKFSRPPVWHLFVKLESGSTLEKTRLMSCRYDSLGNCAFKRANAPAT